ncbi:P-loop NTPase, partial [Myxococcota bacterium]|nr:P-loop NTPase [Myxococcota bacterium]
MDRRPTDRTNNEQASSSASRSDSIRISKKASESIIAAAAPPPKRSRKAKNFSAPKNVIAVGGGKGGTGKSLLAANLGVVLSQQGRRVIMVDADLGGANLHTCLGMPTPKTTISDFISRRVGELSDIVIDTGIERLSLISGALDQMGAANPKYTQKLRFLREISRLDVDDVIIDLGGGTGFNVLDFFLIADHRILTVAPEPTAVENAYRFIKAIYYRRLKMAEFEWDLKALIQDVLEDKNARGLKTPADLVRLVGERDAQAAQRL